jgi:hypothetical protein
MLKGAPEQNADSFREENVRPPGTVDEAERKRIMRILRDGPGNTLLKDEPGKNLLRDDAKKTLQGEWHSRKNTPPI